jgi:secreted PhoX family phosphatase
LVRRWRAPRYFGRRNHEVNLEDVEEDGATPVPHVEGATYDAEAVAGGNCAGGPSPWRTWLTCEEEFETLGAPHGYVFGPWAGSSRGD